MFLQTLQISNYYYSPNSDWIDVRFERNQRFGSYLDSKLVESQLRETQNIILEKPIQRSDNYGIL